MRRTRVDANVSRGQCATHRSQTYLFRLMLCVRCDAQLHSPHLWGKLSHEWRGGGREARIVNSFIKTQKREGLKEMSESTRSVKPIRMALLGLGQRGLQHLKALWTLQQEGMVQLVALGDAFAQNLEEAKIQRYVPGFQAHDIVHSTNFAALMDAQPDALYICLPPNVHNGEVIQAAQAGIHLFVEKPMSLFLDEALAMEKAIAEANIISTVGFQQRFDVRHEAMKTFLADKTPILGQYVFHAPFEAHSVKHTHTETQGGPTNRVWTANRAWSGGTVVEGGIHPLDLWRYWFGNVVWVQATYNHRPPHEIFDGADNPYAYAVTFGFANGALGSMTLSRLRKVYATQSLHQVLWSEGHLCLEDKDVALYHYSGAYPPTTVPSRESVRSVLPVAQAQDTTLAIARSFALAIREGDASLVRSPFDDAMNSLAAVIAANVSDELGGVKVNLDKLLTAPEYAQFRAKPA